MLSTAYVMGRQVGQPQPSLQLVDLAEIGEPNDQGLVIGKDGIFWIDPGELYWVRPARDYLRRRR